MNENNGYSQEVVDENVLSDCYHCEDTFDEDDLVCSEYDNHNRCESCHDETHCCCADCGDEVHNDSTTYIDENSTDVCEDCSYDYNQCYECDERGHVDNMHYCEHEGETYCDRCYVESSSTYEWAVRSNDFVNNFKDFTTLPFAESSLYSKLIMSKRSMGIEIETNFKESVDSSELGDYIAEKLAVDKEEHGGYEYGAGVNVVYDGSITNSEHRHGLEVVLNPRRGGLLINDMEVTTKAMKEYGAYISKKCGYHLHVDSRDYDWYHFSVLVLFTKLIEPHIYSWCPASRLDSRWCRPVSQSIRAFDYIDSRDSFMDFYYDNCRFSFDKYNDKRYHGLNLHSHFQANQGVEFRYHSGTINADKMKHWSVLWSCVMDKCYDVADEMKANDGYRSNFKLYDTPLFASLKKPRRSQDDIWTMQSEMDDSNRNEEGHLIVDGNYIMLEQKLHKVLNLDDDATYSLPALLNFANTESYLMKPCLTINSLFDLFEIPTETQDFYRMRQVELSNIYGSEEHIDRCFENVTSFWTFENGIFKAKDLLENRVPKINILDGYDDFNAYSRVSNPRSSMSEYILDT